MDGLLQKGYAALAPVTDVHGGQKPHANEDIDRADVSAIGQRGLCRANHSLFQIVLSSRIHSCAATPRKRANCHRRGVGAAPLREA